LVIKSGLKLKNYISGSTGCGIYSLLPPMPSICCENSYLPGHNRQMPLIKREIITFGTLNVLPAFLLPFLPMYKSATQLMLNKVLTLVTQY